MEKAEYKNMAITFLLSSILLVIIHNLPIDSYIKNVTIPFLVLTIEYLYFIKDKIVNKKIIYLLVLSLIVILSNIFIKVDGINLILNVIAIPFLLSTSFFYLTNKNYELNRNSLYWIFYIIPEGLLKNLELLKSKKEKKTSLANIILGICIGTLFAIVILSLLMDADKYFMAFIDNIKNIINFNMIIKNIILLCIYFICLFSIFINILKIKDKKVDKITINHQDNTTLTIILSFVNLVFVLFIISEISKITTNFLKIPIEYTYAEYAREGFFQLMAITAINFAIIIYHLYFIDNLKECKTIKNLIISLIIFSIILIFNSYYRLFLYINHYGFTILRLQVILFLLMELVLFLVFIKKIVYKLKYKDNHIIFTIILITYILNLYLCNSSFINLIN